MKSDRFFRKTLIYTLALIAVFAMGTLAYGESTGDLTISGGTEGVDYTYEDGLLTILKSGDYTIGMAEGVAETGDQILIKKSADLSSLTLTLDSVTMKTTETQNIKIEAVGSNLPDLNMAIVLQGDNVLTAKGHPFYASGNSNPILTIRGSGTLAVEATGTSSVDGYNNFAGKSITFESGDITMKNTDIMALQEVHVKGGTLTVDSPRDTIYVNGSYKQTGGTVNLSAGERCIFATGVGQTQPEDGIQILGGDITMTTTGSFAVMAGNRSKKNVVIDTEGTVEINSNTVGIVLVADSSVDMNNGTLQINAPVYGIYVNGNASTGSSSAFHVNGGETEITTNRAAIGFTASANRDIIYSDDYFHKNYDGADQASREEVSDTDILNDNGISKQYVLITPAYRITYDLGDGALPDGVSNPVKYSRVDEFTLNDPVPFDSERPFEGWTGTDLDGKTMSVTIAEGSKGDRSYTAHYAEPPAEYMITYDPNGGKLGDSTEKLIEKHTDGESITIAEAPVRSGYTFKYWEGSDGSRYQPGDVLTVDGDLTLTAKWEQDPVDPDGEADDSESKSGGDASSSDRSPDTGDNDNLLAASALLMISLLSISLLARRRNN